MEVLKSCILIYKLVIDVNLALNNHSVLHEIRRRINGIGGRTIFKMEVGVITVYFEKHSLSIYNAVRM